jgi:hypothetical protein
VLKPKWQWISVVVAVADRDGDGDANRSLKRSWPAGKIRANSVVCLDLLAP